MCLSSWPCRPDHDPAAHLVPQVGQVPHAPQTRLQGAPDVERSVQITVRGLDLQEVPVRPGLPPQLVVLPGPLAYGERHGHVVAPLDLPHHLGEPRGVQPVVLSGLQDHRLDALGRYPAHAFEDLRAAHAVAGEARIAGVQAAVEAGVRAEAGELDDPAKQDPVPHEPAPCLIRRIEELLHLGRVLEREERRQVVDIGSPGFRNPGKDVAHAGTAHLMLRPRRPAPGP